MIQTVLDVKGPSKFLWLDVVEPTAKELNDLAAQYNLHAASVEDCLEPDHLPKYENFTNFEFFILRAYDEASNGDIEADTVQELSRKVAIFKGPGFLITIHRIDQVFFKALRSRWQIPAIEQRRSESIEQDVLFDVVGSVLRTYENPIQLASDTVDGFEEQVFRNMNAPLILQELYLMKRRALVFKRLMRMTGEVITRLQLGLNQSHSFNIIQWQDIKDTLDHCYFFADELLDTVTNLVNLQISLASHRTNEVVRVLTVFSVFFMPLTFIVGIYGMNFRVMPELEWSHGYAAVWGLMVFISTIIFIWFRRRGWLR